MLVFFKYWFGYIGFFWAFFIAAYWAKFERPIRKLGTLPDRVPGTWLAASLAGIVVATALLWPTLPTDIQGSAANATNCAGFPYSVTCQ